MVANLLVPGRLCSQSLKELLGTDETIPSRQISLKLPEIADNGAVVPRHHITQLTFTNNGETVMAANFSTAVSKNPYINFSYRGAKAGDTLKVSWVDTLGDSDELKTVLQ